jgi:hypothetical protein
LLAAFLVAAGARLSLYLRQADRLSALSLPSISQSAFFISMYSFGVIVM